MIESYGPGQAWQSSGHSNKNNYRINNVEDCCLFLGVGGTRDNPQLLQHGHYLAYELDVIETRDEDGHIKYSFMDKEGQLILSRNVADKDTLDTYYVYDDFGCLCFVLPPKAVDNLVEMSQDILDKYAYQYRYDYRHRCISKRCLIVIGLNKYMIIITVSYLLRMENKENAMNGAFSAWTYWIVKFLQVCIVELYRIVKFVMLRYIRSICSRQC